jgi:hypothetical protein|tara:strand:+ start:5666 stop:6061 length:396 start_codon:yes stop_codon:yes gene_type:complete
MKQHITLKAREMYLSGMSTRQVAKELNKGFATIYRWCKDIIRTKSESLKGDKHPLYKGGHIDENGYNRIWVDGKLCFEHRVLVEKDLNCKLARDEYVHHINGNPSDNRLENLKVMSASEHTAYHNLERAKV